MDFKSTRRPPINKDRFFLDDSLLRTELMAGSQVLILLGSALTGKPKYLIGRPPILQLKVSATSSNHEESTLTPISWLLLKLTSSHKLIQKAEEVLSLQTSR
jgi:hypothetical protein